MHVYTQVTCWPKHWARMLRGLCLRWRRCYRSIETVYYMSIVRFPPNSCRCNNLAIYIRRPMTWEGERGGFIFADIIPKLIKVELLEQLGRTSSYKLQNTTQTPSKCKQPEQNGVTAHDDVELRALPSATTSDTRCTRHSPVHIYVFMYVWSHVARLAIL